MYRAPLCLAALLAFGCSDALQPAALPDRAVPIVPTPEMYATWWSEVEACSGLTGDLSRISWYEVPGVLTFEGADDRLDAGEWIEDGSRIVLAGLHVDDARVVRHEMLHALLHRPGHPELYFDQLCADLVVR